MTEDLWRAFAKQERTKCPSEFPCCWAVGVEQSTISVATRLQLRRSQMKAENISVLY